MNEFIKIKKYKDSFGLAEAVIVISKITSLTVCFGDNGRQSTLYIRGVGDCHIISFKSHNEALDYRDELQKEIERYYEFKSEAEQYYQQKLYEQRGDK